MAEAEPFYRRLIELDDKLELEANITVFDARQSFACLLRKLNKEEEADRVQFRNKSDNPKIDEQPPEAIKTVRGGVLNGKALRLPKPAYPDEARAAGVSGTVVVMVTITEGGKVVRACALKGHPLLWLASERAAYASEFSPTLLSGMPVRVTGVITYNFVRQ